MATNQKGRQASRSSPKSKKELSVIGSNAVEEKIGYQAIGKNFFGCQISYKKIIPIFLAILVVLALLGYFFRDKFIVSIVNGKPIFRYELNRKLISSFGNETLENMIVEQLVKEEIAKQKIQVKEEEVNSELEKIAKSLGDQAKIEDVLKSQGSSLEEFRTQLRMRLEINKIMEKGITILDSEVDQFIKTNGQALVATGEAERKVEAKGRIKEQKINEQIQKWISDLLAKAKISRFLK